VVVLGLLFLPLAPERLAAQGSKDDPTLALSDDTALALAEQDSESRNTEKRLRILEEKMDRLMQKLDAQRGEKPGEKWGGKPSGADRPALEKAKAAEWKAKIADEKAWIKDKAQSEMKDLKRRLGEQMSPEEIGRLKEEIHAKVQQAQKRIQEEVGKNISPERMEEIQRRVDDALKRSNQQLNEALKKSTEQLERAKVGLAQAKKAPVAEPRPEKFPEEQRNLERRMDRLEQKMDRVLQSLEKQGKSAK